MNDLMVGILGRHYGDIGQVVDLEIYDGDSSSSTALMFDSDADKTSIASEAMTPAAFHIVRLFDMAGHRWSIVLRSLPSFEARQQSEQTKYHAILGLGGTLALTLVVWLLAYGRTRALQIAQNLTRELSDRTVKHATVKPLRAIPQSS